MDQEAPLAFAPKLGQRDAEAEVCDQPRSVEKDSDVVQRRCRRRHCRRRQASSCDVDQLRRQEPENADVEFRRQRFAPATEEDVDERRQAGRAASDDDDAFKIRLVVQISYAGSWTIIARNKTLRTEQIVKEKLYGLRPFIAA